MAMAEKVQGGGGGARQEREQMWLHHYQIPGQQHLQIMDERDGFLLWLRGEFAAANAIIDALCHHLKTVGETGEYDGVIGSVQQRRCNWNPVLHLQQYFPVTEVVYALQQVGMNRQQRRGLEGSGKWGKEYNRRSGGRNGQRAEEVKKGKEMNAYVDKNECLLADEAKENNEEERKGTVLKFPRYGSVESNNTGGLLTTELEHESEDLNDQHTMESKGSCNVVNDTHSLPLLHEKQNVPVVPKTFIYNEIYDGKTFNVAEGMELYEELLDDSEVSKLTTLVNDLRAAGRGGKLKGQTFVAFKRPMYGHGREIIQFGLPVADLPPDEEAAAELCKDHRVEPIPNLFQDIIERLLAMQVVTMKPDSCAIDIFNEGDYSRPHMWPRWYGRPVCVLLLTECDMIFGKAIDFEHPGHFRGAFKLPLTPGSVLVMQGRSADFARHAIRTCRKRCILVTLVKSQPKRIPSSDSQHFSSSAATAIPSNWVPPRKPSNRFRPPTSPKHYNPVKPIAMLPAPTVPPQLPSPIGTQTIFFPTPVTAAVSYPAHVSLPPSSAGWQANPLMPTPPRIPVPGTGVFLPPSSHPLTACPATDSTAIETIPVPEKDNVTMTLSSSKVSAKDEDENNVQHIECNGKMNGSGEEKSFAKQEKLETADLKTAVNPGGLV